MKIRTVLGKKNLDTMKETEIFVVDVNNEDISRHSRESWYSIASIIKNGLFLIMFTFLVQIVLRSYGKMSGNMSEIYYESMIFEEQFKEFIDVYKKKYESEEAKNEAFEIFISNMKEMNEDEMKNPNTIFGFHQWMDVPADMMIEKFSLDDFSPPPLEGISRFDGFTETVARPPSHSLRDKATPVKNQGSCGSCWAFATVASVETAHVLAGNRLVGLSEQEMLECDTTNKGCRGGVRSYAMNFVVRNGLVPESTYPYTAKEGEQCHIGNVTKVFIKDYRLLSQSEDTMADWLFKTGPITFGMNVTRSMYAYRSGVYRPSQEECSTKSEGSHAMTIMGYGTESGQDYWLVKNSWGDYWGDSGYFKLARGGNVCGMANNVVAPIY